MTKADLTELYDYLNHQFQDWNKLYIPDKTKWNGEDKEKFITSDNYFRARFRDWALLNDVPKKYWEKVYEEFRND